MTITADHLHALTVERGIALDIVKERGYFSAFQPADLIDLTFTKAQAKLAPALVLPRWNVHGQSAGWQIRPDRPRQFKDGKVGKYELPQRDHLILDVHPRLQPLLHNPQMPLWITESIPKGDALTSQGACTIALGGVWGFRGSNQYGGKVILPDWEHVALNAREVIVVFDSDIYFKPEVERALKALYAFLRSKSAIPRLVQWPDEYRQQKWGVDDFLAQGHTLDDLLGMVPPQGPLPPRPPRPEATGTTDDTYPYSDAYNAQQLVKRHGQILRYCAPWKIWLVWTGTHWARDTTGTVMRLMRETVKGYGAELAAMDEKATDMLLAHIKSSLSTSRLEAAIRQALSFEGVSIDADRLDADPWLLNCANGTLDLRTGALHPHRQADLLTKCLAIPYDPEARCPQWIAFLEKIMADSAMMIAFLQKALGYSLTGSTREQCFFLLHGPTKTGKSTFTNAAKALLGPYAKEAEMSTFLYRDKETVRNDLAALAGTRLVSAIETDKGKRLAEALIKKLTGGVDTITARFLFEELFEFRPQFKVFLATNDKPKVGASDDAMWERIRLIPFVVQIPKEDRDKRLDEKLLTELPGILAWAVRGCLAWQKDDGLGEPAAVMDATQGYRDEMDTIGRFLDDVCLCDPNVRVKATMLASAYQAWCRQTAEYPIGNNDFIEALEKRGYERKRGHAHQYYWHGLGLYSTEDEPQGKHGKENN